MAVFFSSARCASCLPCYETRLCRAAKGPTFSDSVRLLGEALLQPALTCTIMCSQWIMDEECICSILAYENHIISTQNVSYIALILKAVDSTLRLLKHLLWFFMVQQGKKHLFGSFFINVLNSQRTDYKWYNLVQWSVTMLFIFAAATASIQSDPTWTTVHISTTAQQLAVIGTLPRLSWERSKSAHGHRQAALSTN